MKYLRFKQIILSILFTMSAFLAPTLSYALTCESLFSSMLPAYKGMPNYEVTDLRDSKQYFEEIERIEKQLRESGSANSREWEPLSSKNRPEDLVGHGISGYYSKLDRVGHGTIRVFSGIVSGTTVKMERGDRGAFYIIKNNGVTEEVSILSEIIYFTRTSIGSKPAYPGSPK